MEVVDELVTRWKKACRILVAFGSPSVGLFEILEREGLKLDDVVDFVVNMFPDQGTATVRTVEAIYVCLGVLNLFVSGL
jgi:predicted SPOUT superfamily RNA methylase MTH1